MTDHTWVDVLLSIAAALLLCWLALVITLAIRRPKGGLLKESLRVLPEHRGNGDHRDEPLDYRPEPAPVPPLNRTPATNLPAIPIRPRSGGPLLTRHPTILRSQVRRRTRGQAASAV